LKFIIWNLIIWIKYMIINYLYELYELINAIQIFSY
jgi:hypothetical protein